MIDIANVTFTSVVGTTFKIRNADRARRRSGSQSTGIRSIRFMRKTHTKMVSDSGAMSLLWPWNASRTKVSTKPHDELDRGLELAGPARRHVLRDLAEQTA